MKPQPGDLVQPGAARALPSLRTWRNAVLAIFALNGFVVASWVTRIPQVRDILHASTAEMGVLLVGLAVGNVVGLFTSGHIVARLGATRTLRLLNCVAWGCLLVGGVILAVEPNLLTLMLVLVVCGGSANAAGVALNLSGVANERMSGTTTMPLFHASYSVGTVAGAAIASLLLLVGIPAGVDLVGVGALGIVATLVLVRYLRPAEQPAEADAEAAPSRWRERLAAWRDRRVILIGLIVLGMTFAEGSANDWLSLGMVDGHHQSASVGAAVFGAFVTAMTVARVLGAKALDRYGRVPVLRASAGTAVVGLLLFITAPYLPVVIAGVVLWGFGTALGFPVGISAAADDPRTATAGVATVATIGYCGTLIGPPVIGFLGQRFGLLNALLLVLALVALAGALSPAARQPRRAEATASGTA